MNTCPDDSETPSRRTFTRSVAAALIAAPFAVAARGQGRNDSQIMRPDSNQCPISTVPHEPPIVISGGSLSMECEVEMLRRASINNPPRKHLYKFDGYLYSTMIRLEVITEYDKFFTYDCIPLGATPSPTLKIWLQRLISGRMVADDIDTAKTDAHILIRYTPVQHQGQTLDAAVVETDNEFGDPQGGFKSHGTFKHYHQGYGNSRHFRIGRWKLMRSNGTRIAEHWVGQTSGAATIVGFQLIPRFDHLGDRFRLLTGSEPKSNFEQ